MLQLLETAGLHIKDLAQQGAPTLTNYPVTNASAIRILLDMGANPNPRGRFPLVSQAVFQGQVETARLLLERGGDPNAKGQQDATPLMMAAAAPQADPTLVRLLIERNAEVSARDHAGRTALDWAMTQGDTDVVHALRQAGVSNGANRLRRCFTTGESASPAISRRCH